MLIPAFKELDERSRGDLVIVLGQTGDGKSTMLASLLYGPDKLEEKVLKETIKIAKLDKNGNPLLKDGIPQVKKKTMKTKVIDYKDDFKKNVNVAFGIGHSLS